MPKPLSISLKQKKQEDNKQLKTSKEPLKGGRIPPKALHITALSHILKGIEKKTLTFVKVNENTISLASLSNCRYSEEVTKTMIAISKTSRIHVWKNIRNLDAELLTFWEFPFFFKSFAGRRMPYLDNLKHFSIRLSPCNLSNLTGKQLERLAFETFRQLNNLQTFSILCSPHSGVVSISEVNKFLACIAKNSTHLKKLDLSFVETSDYFMFCLIIALNINRSYMIYDRFISSFGRNMGRYFRDLKQLDLLLGCPQHQIRYSVINENILNDFYTNLCTNLVSLEKLTLRLRGGFKINDKLLKLLVKLISTKLTKLQELTIITVGAEKVTGPGLKAFGNEISSKLKNIKSLAIDLEQCKLLPSEIKIVSQKLAKEMKYLKYLDFMKQVLIDNS